MGAHGQYVIDRKGCETAIIRSICAVAGYTSPEICTPVELSSEEPSDV